MDSQHKTLRYIFDKFINDVESSTSICGLKSLRYDNNNTPNYTPDICQELYLLRYYIAYFNEYYNIFTTLIKTMDFKFSSQNHFLSIGCGSSYDYTALKSAICNCRNEFEKEPIVNYLGIDPVRWKCRAVVQEGDSLVVKKEAIGEWINGNPFDFSKNNIIFFPKSLSDISKIDFNTLIATMKKTDWHCSRKHVAILGSFPKENSGESKNRFNTFCETYKFTNNYMQTQRRDYDTGSQEKYSYPQDIRNYIENIYTKCKKYNINKNHCNDNGCINGKINKTPVCTNRYFKYSIITMEKQ